MDEINLHRKATRMEGGEIMKRPLKVLFVEDSRADAQLLRFALEEEGFELGDRRVYQLATMNEALDEQQWDVILCDFSMPRFSALDALGLLRQKGLDTPFIVVSGTIGEEMAVEMMRAGAHDYLLKDKLTRLGEAIRREMREAESRKKRRRAEAGIKHLNRVLRAIRGVNRFIVRERDPQRLIQQACCNLVETRGYGAAWIAVFDDARDTVLTAEAGCGEAFAEVAEQLRNGKLPHCGEAALQSPDVLVLDDPRTACDHCPLRDSRGDHGGFAVRLENKGRVYGLLSVHLPSLFVENEEETALFSEIASDLAFALRHLEVEEQREQMQTSLAQSDRLASMGMLAAGVAHEINNPLTYMVYNLDCLNDTLPGLLSALGECVDVMDRRPGEGPREALTGLDRKLLRPDMLEDTLAQFKDVLQGTHRIKDIARSLGTFSRVEEDRLVPVDLMDCIEAAVNMVNNEIKYRARLVKERGEISPIVANDGKLSQVFLNLLVNATHAIEDGDVEGNEIRVRTWQEGQEVCAEVRDTGKGIASESIPHLFKPFFTTKDIGVGTGLGLPISKNIIEGYGGRIEVTTEVGVGTSFVVRLPTKYREPTAEVEVSVQDDTEPEVRRRILIVDDEASIRKAIKRVLRAHEVIEAACGEEAMRILEGDHDYDLVLCDMMIPRVSGLDLHQWLAANNPQLAAKVIFITGGAFTPRAREYLEKVDNLLLEKPFDVMSLVQIVGDRVRASRKSSN